MAQPALENSIFTAMENCGINIDGKFIASQGAVQSTAPSKQSTARELYAELLRIVAAFTVVFQHTVTSVWYDVPVDTGDFFALNFLNSIARFGVGVFIMISGAFMLSPKYPHTPQKILRHNLVRILILLVVWVCIYGVVDAIREGVHNGLGIGESVVNILAAPLDLFVAPPTHLWFLYAIAGLYVITPALRVFTEHASKHMVLYVIAIFFAFGLVIPTVNHLLAKLAHFHMYQNIGIRGATTFAGFYLTGFYISQYGLGRIARRVLYSSALISWFISFFYSTYFSLVKDTPNEFFFGNFRPMTFLIAAAVFCFFRTRYGERRTSDTRILDISKCMLGVYLLHPMFIKIFYGLKLSLLEPHPLITAPLMAVVFFGLSLGAVFLFRLIPGVKKIL
ncbi:acyltransferase [Fibrobacter sp.]|uniref:acyltransferase n=1 Tax=Fibrobacter sp. TaxID=35828 RepID=UPI00388FC250